MKRVWILLIILSMLAFGCATTGAVPQKTQLQIREFQTRTYDTNDTKMVMKAMLNVLQDDGFIVKNAVPEVGLLTAEKQIDIEDKTEAFFAAFFAGAQARWKKACFIECSANISEYGKQSRVRVNFQLKILDNKGGIVELKQIDTLVYYNFFFSKVDKAIYIEKEKL